MKGLQKSLYSVRLFPRLGVLHSVGLHYRFQMLIINQNCKFRAVSVV